MNTRDKLIEAAFRLFLAHGYDGTGIREILKQTGLSKGAFYHHFESKAALLSAVVGAYLPIPFAELDWPHHQALSAASQKAAINEMYRGLDLHIAAYGGQVMRFFTFFFDALSHLDDYRIATEANYAHLIDALSAALKAEGEAAPGTAEQQARAFIAGLEGEVFLRAVSPKISPITGKED